MNNTPNSERIHIGIFGNRNAGKSSVINAITGQELAIVSEQKGTTTDPVYKAMELLPLGPVVVIDTPGLDDVGDLGELRISKSYQVLNKTDMCLLVIDANEGVREEDIRIIRRMKDKKLPTLMVVNKVDLLEVNHPINDVKDKKLIQVMADESVEVVNHDQACLAELRCKETIDAIRMKSLQMKSQSESGIVRYDWDVLSKELDCPYIFVSANSGFQIEELKELIGQLYPRDKKNKYIVRDLIQAFDFVVLVTPIDESAPKGRLILPQQQTIREILEVSAVPILTTEGGLSEVVSSVGKEPALVVTDSQAFAFVAENIPQHWKLTSFSILFARYKGDLDTLVEGATYIRELKAGDTVLISEGCTHHRQCNDIGTVKLPNWLTNYTKQELQFEFTSGMEYPMKLSKYALVIHCGGCMLNDKEMEHRILEAHNQGVPITNYGTAIAYMNEILERSIEHITN